MTTERRHAYVHAGGIQWDRPTKLNELLTGFLLEQGAPAAMTPGLRAGHWDAPR